MACCSTERDVTLGSIIACSLINNSHLKIFYLHLGKLSLPTFSVFCISGKIY